jgi:hypothetical protein
MPFGRAAAHQAVDSVQHMRWVDQLVTAQAWSDEQRQRWESTCRNQETVIKELQTWVDDLKQALEWSEGQRTALQEASWQPTIDNHVAPVDRPLMAGGSQIVHRLKRLLTHRERT